jgi:hypothetical protein
MVRVVVRYAEALFAKDVIGVMSEGGKHGAYFVKQRPWIDEDAYKVFTSLTIHVAAKTFELGLGHSWNICNALHLLVTAISPMELLAYP